MTRSVRISGHFGELLQGRLGPQGPVALITLPCPVLACTASQGAGPLHLRSKGETVMRPADLRQLLTALGLPRRGRFQLTTEMPVGAGLGASTAARVALARAAGVDDPQRIAMACLAVEGASDPVMFPAPTRLLWASREGRVLDRLPPLPDLEVLGGVFGPPRRTDARDNRFADIADLAADWRTNAGDLPALARLASASARRCLAMRGPVDDPTEALAARWGALGFAIAHTGSARALLYAPGTVPPGAAHALRAAGLTDVLQFSVAANRQHV